MARQSTGEGKHSSMVTSTGYCYSDVSAVGNNHHHQQNLQSHQLMMNQLQSFESNPDDHIFNLSTTGMDMAAAGFFGGKPPAIGHQHHGGGPSSSKTTINESSGDQFYGHPQHFNNNSTASESLMVAAAAGYHGVEDDSSMRCVFPCEGNERPSQGLSLSLSSTNPSTIGLQTFELRQPDHHGYFGKSTVNVQDGFWGKSSSAAAAAGHVLQQHVNHGQFFQIRNSKYLGPAQELLNEFCNLGTKQTDHKPKTKAAQPHNTSTSQWLQQDHEDHPENTASTSSKKQQQQPLCNLELLELQKRKTKLLSMLEEVDRRYRHYCDQMKAVVASFETVAGEGAAKVYSALASKAMSRHFRCLRDGIVGQIKTTKQAMGEKDTATPGTTRGETPRLRLLDQTLRQQRAFQQMTMMETHPWRPQRGLPERSVSVLRAWLFEHFLHPYPSDVDKHILARQTGLSRSQVSNWFINARVRLWKPMVEEMYMEETKEHDNLLASSDDNNIGRPSGQIQNSEQTRPEDEKPTPDQLVRRDSECLSSVINNDPKNSKSPRNLPGAHHHYHRHQQQQQHHQQTFGRVADAFGAAMELDFSSYNHQTAGAVSYANENAHQNFGGSGGVSLTLGLQQHGGSGGVSLAFSTPFGAADMEDCQPVQYSLLDGETQNLPYRNLMGAQLLHDLAG